MRIYFSGIGGVAIGPLAEIARDAGHSVQGSDVSESLVTQELEADGISISIGQDGSYLQACHDEKPIDWLVHTAALPPNHPELTLAKQLGIKTVKRDELIAHIISENDLKLIAISGTHGKTTTTGMMVWVLKQLDVPVSYSVGTTLSWGPSGAFDPASDYFVYECDEFDKNFLHFSPHLSLITSIGYDHTDTYPTKESYLEAFTQYVAQSSHTIGWRHDLEKLAHIDSEKIWQLEDAEAKPLTLAGEHNRQNGTLVVKACEYLNLEGNNEIVNSFPGTNRRFEKLGENLYSDYGHHPNEIAATLQMARELSDHVVLIYQPHQNVRQHEIKDQYSDCFTQAEKIYWLPTYLSREDPDLAILSPRELSAGVSNKESIEYVEMDADLWNTIQGYRNENTLVLCMGAGSIDTWLRQQIDKS